MTAQPPVRPRTELLRLEELDEYRFQAFSTDLIAHVFPKSNPFQYGRRGDTQRGIDIVATTDRGKLAAQCRRVKKFTVGDLRKCIAETTYPADRYLILTACEVPTDVRDEIEKHPTWEIWDLRDISRRVGDLPRDAAWLVVDRHFGSAWAEEFVVGAAPAPILEDAPTYFAVTGATGRLLRYDWRTVGRQKELNELDQIVADDTIRVGVLAGRGGIGKTHILYAFAQRQHDVGHSVRFLRRTGQVKADGLIAALRPGDVVVVDDAHRREDLGAILAAIRSVNGAKAILAIRPWSRGGTLAALTKEEFDPAEVRDMHDLRELDRAETRELARQALGGAHELHVEPLVAASWDSPLVTVVGGRLVADGEIQPGLLDRHEEFRRAVFSRFEADLIRPIVERVGEQNAHAVMDFLAAVGPIRLENRALVEAAATFLGTDAPTFITAVGLLEEGGVLLRRGRLLRITPDVLSDDILHRACVTAAGATTGYAERVFDAVAAASPGTVFANLAELDWRQRQTGGPDVFDQIWDRMLRRLADAEWWQRAEILNHIAEIAYFQPSRVMEFVKFALGSVGEDPAGLADDVRLGLPKMLRGVAYSPDHLPDAIQALWVLGRDDRRPTNQHPDHAMRVLEDVASYGLRKPLAVGQAVVNAVRGWVRDADAFDHVHSPLDILDPVLAKSGTEHRASGAAIHFEPFVVNAKVARALRDAAVDLLRDLAGHTRTAVRVRVLKSLDDALHVPVAYFAMTITDKQRDQWQDEELALLDIIASIVGADPILDMRIRHALDWHCRHRPAGRVRDRARQVAAAVSDTDDLSLTVALSTPWDIQFVLPFDVDPDDKYEIGNKLMTQLQKRAAAYLLRRYPDPLEGAQVIVRFLDRLAALGSSPNPQQFLVELSQMDIAYTDQICAQIAADKDHRLSDYLAPLLAGTVASHPDRAIRVATDALAAGNVAAVRSVAQAVGMDDWRKSNGVWGLVEALAGHTDAWVRRSIAFSLQFFADVDRDRAARLLARIDYGGSDIVADEVLSVVGHNKKFPLDVFTDDEVDGFLDRLVDLDQVDKYWIGEFIGLASARRPVPAARLFIRRHIEARTRSEKYRAVPWNHDRPTLGALDGAPGYEDLLREVRDGSLGSQGVEQMHVADLFATISGGYGETALRVLQEWIDSGQPDRVVGATRLLSEAPWRFVFSHEAFTANVLERAYALGDECYKRAMGELYSLTTSGTWEGTPGEPAPRHVEQRDRAADAAARYAEGSPVRRFYEAIRDNAVQEIADELVRDEEEFAT